MFSQTFRFLYDSRTSKSVDPGTELADAVDGIFVVQIAVFFVEFSLCAAGKIPFYFFPDISLVVELYLDMFRLFGEAVSPYLGSDGINDGTIACIDFLSPRPQIQDAI